MRRRSGQTNAAGLEALLAPVSLDEFLRGQFGRGPLHLSGDSGRFGDLLDEDGLARLLETHSLDDGRLRVVRQGKDIPRERYVRTRRGMGRIDGGAFSLLLDSGATLIVNHIDDLVPAVAAIADDVGDRLGARTAVNLYASWRSEHGFDPHWDHHDVLVLQLAGRKKWSIYRPTHMNPLRGDPFVPPGKEDTPDFEELLEDGDLLYVPRGWIHAPVPAGDLSLHLTISITRPTGAGFLEWLASELKADPEVRATMPFAVDEKSLDEWKARMGAIVGRALAGPAPERYLARKDADRGARPRFSFPDFGRVPPSEWNDATMLRSASLHRFVVGSAGDGGASVEALGQSWPCGAAVAAAIARLTSTRPMRLGELQDGLSNGDAAQLRQLLVLLATMGLLSTARC